MSWSDTQVVANVASGSKSGVAQVLQGGVWSNSVNLTVSTPKITNVTPATAVAGTQVTITGTGFGASQGNGNVWLGSTYGVVVSWSDTQIVASVASGSSTGVAQVLQGGVWSNAVNFAVTTLNIASVTPASAPVGAAVIITGSGFGTLQDVSTVSFNGTIAATRSWSDTKIVAAVSNGTTTGPVSVTVGGVTSNSLNFTVAAPPSITSVSPNTGPAGTQVSITGSGFGNAQGSSTVQLGSRPGTVVNWSDTQILATVASGSTSGTVQVQQNGAASNSVAFTVVTATITTVSPTSAAAGTQVTIIGSGFGSAQGTGQVWLGTAAAQASSWSDSQVVATVAAGSNSGSAHVLQNGVWSNSVAFIVTGGPPHITSINPNAGIAGTVVTIQGTGFGSSQGSGIAWIGAANASVNSWTDTQVSATVGTSAVSGIVKIQQNGTWGNAITFTVPSANSVTLNPNIVNMLVGDTRPITALNSTGRAVSGLTWTSSDATVASLSTDDPPVITAVAPGNVTITAGAASADVTVYAGPALPVGTLLWSNPGNGSGVDNLFSAVPSYTGVADVFAAQGDGSVQAITSDGAVAWTTSVSGGPGNSYLPDFQGGLVVFGSGTSNNIDTSILRLDGLTGQPYPAYTATTNEAKRFGLEYPVVHTDGTIFTVDYACDTDCIGDNPDTTDGAWVVAVDPSTGTAKFKVPLANSVSQGTNADSWCGATPGSSTTYIHSWPYSLTIAGDGYLYTAYTTSDFTGNEKKSPTQPWPDAAYQYFALLQQDTSQSNFGAAFADYNALLNLTGGTAGLVFNNDLYQTLQSNTLSNLSTALQEESNLAPLFTHECDSSQSSITKLHVLRVGTDGSSSDVVVHQWNWSISGIYTPTPSDIFNGTLTQQGSAFSFNGLNIITNADTGIVFSWEVDLWGYCTLQTDSGCSKRVDTIIEDHLTTMAGGSLASDVIWDDGVPGQVSPVVPVLQLQDGSYVGQAISNLGVQSMVAFDASGNVKWTMPGYYPQIATADGGIIAASGTTFDANGLATTQMSALPTFSWKAAYQLGSTEEVVSGFDLANIATTFAAVPGGNLTGNGFSLRHHTFGIKFCNTGTGGDGPCTSLVQNMSFSYLQGIDDSNYQSACDFSVSSSCDNGTAHPEWVDTIKIEALKAYKAAFANLPAILSNHVAASVLNNSVNPPFDHTAYVDGEWFVKEGPGCPHPGDTKNPNWSWVFYMSIMCDAQRHLGPYGNSTYFTPPFSDSANFQKLAAAIGRGIGNTAAHETGHQISFDSRFRLPGLDCGPGSPEGKACDGGLNSVYEAAEAGGWNYIDWNPPIDWELDDKTALQNYFNCTVTTCK